MMSLKRLAMALVGVAALTLATIVPAGAAAAAAVDSGNEAAPAPPATRAEARDRVARMSDGEARDLLLEHLDRTLPAADATAGGNAPWAITGGQIALSRLAAIFERRDEFGAEWNRLGGVIALGQARPWLAVLLGLALCLFAGAVLEWFLLRRGSGRRAMAGPVRDGVIGIDELLKGAAARAAGGLLFLATAFVAAQILPGLAPGTRMIVNALVWLTAGSRVAWLLTHALLLPNGGVSPWPLSHETARSVARWLGVTTIFILLLLINRDLLIHLGAAEFFSFLVRLASSSALIGVILIGILAVRRAIVRSRTAPSNSVLGERWHQFAVIYVIGLYLLAIYGYLVTGKPMIGPGLTSLALVLAVPAFDYALRLLAERMANSVTRPQVQLWEAAQAEAADAGPSIVEEHTGQAGTASEPAADAVPAAQAQDDERTERVRDALLVNFRLILALLIIVALAALWKIRIIGLVEVLVGPEVAATLLEVAVAGLFTFFIWQLIKAVVSVHGDTPAVLDPSQGGDGGGVGLTRTQTLLPLIAKTIGWVLIVVLVLISLSAFGIDIGPLLAGAGVIGLAIGFGAQTLVRDIVSGVFFLLDDAFRMGEYLQIGNIRGTVEKISVRSLRLRHHRGPLHTLPYGEIQHITNYSRDYVIMKFELRVPFETDVERVRKLIKQIGIELMENEELAAVILEPLKSQGVNRMDDSSFVIRCKFTTLPGKQFGVRRHAYAKIRERFEAEGIKFAPRRVVVETVASDGDDAAAAAAAAAASVANESGSGGHR